MPKAKTRAAFDVESDQLAWLQQMAGDYKLPDISKALRIVIDRADCGRLAPRGPRHRSSGFSLHGQGNNQKQLD